MSSTNQVVRIFYAFYFWIALLFLLFAPAEAQQTREKYGQSCNKTSRCDSRASLTCKDNLCACLMPDTMRYDEERQVCAVISGEKCVFTTVEAHNSERSYQEEFQCIANASCKDGYCGCDSAFYENSSTCVPKKLQGEPCDSTVACNDEHLLVCSHSGICECNGTSTVYDETRQACVKVAGSTCKTSADCVENAVCPNNSLICKCTDKFFANSDNLCERRHGPGEFCQQDSDCLSEDRLELVCHSNGICGCNETYSLLDESEGICRVKAGAACDRRSNSPCVKNSACHYKYSIIGEGNRCSCNEGYFQGENGTCILKFDHGMSCRADDNCKEKLKCGQSGTCECQQAELFYDTVQQKCVTLVGELCGRNDLGCVSNSRCPNSYETYDGVRKCECNTGYKKGGNGTCLASHSKTCSNHWLNSCNTEQGLICMDGQCVCKYRSLQDYNLKLESCVSQVGGPCDDSIPCIENSHCASAQERNLTGSDVSRCFCNDGFIPIDGECKLAFGEACDHSSPNDCETFAPLHCIQGRCQCDNMEVYDWDSGRCRGRVGQSCLIDNTREFYCMTGSVCVEREFPGEKSNGICGCKIGWLSTNEMTCEILEQNTNSDGETSFTQDYNNVSEINI